LLEDAIECPAGQIVRRLAGDRDAAKFRTVFELPMASARRDQKPPVVLEQSNSIPNLHTVGSRYAASALAAMPDSMAASAASAEQLNEQDALNGERP